MSDEVTKEEIIKNFSKSMNYTIRKTIENNIDDTGVRGFQADTKDDKSKLVFQIRTNAEDGWWEHFNIEETTVNQQLHIGETTPKW